MHVSRATSIRRALFLAISVLPALLLAGAGHGAVPSSRMQRMLIGAGCYRIAGHATGAVAAYCLDQDGAAPRQGAILGETPAALGEATVSVGGKTMPLGTALSRHLLRVEGTDTADQLSLVNTTDQAISLCVSQPVVIMGNGAAYSADLKRIYGRIVDLMRLDAPAPAEPADEADSHGRLQRHLWDLVNEADERELSAPWMPTGVSAAADGGCAVGGTAAVLCR